MHLISVDDLSEEYINSLFNTTTKIKNGNMFSLSMEKLGEQSFFQDKILGNLFYEPSTRTSASFEAAMYKLGGKVISINDVSYSSVIKGETLTDTIQTMASYVDIIALRHFDEGSAALAANVSDVPIINAGDGSGEHPTQALLDLYTIRESFLSIKNKNVVFFGDLKYGRTVHSLVKLLKRYSANFVFIAPDELQIPDEYFDENKDTKYNDISEMNIKDIDIFYVTRVQKERIRENLDLDFTKYQVDNIIADSMKHNAIIMHPFPRVWEITNTVDKNPRAAYFRQMKNGLFIRMAILRHHIGENNGITFC